MKNKEKNIDYARELALESGKMPPAAVEMEKLVLGTMLIDSVGVENGTFIIGENENVFYKPEHVVLYACIFGMKKRGLPIDMISVIQELKRAGKLNAAGGDHYIIDLTMGVSSSAHIEYHLRIILEKYFARTMQVNCFHTAQELFSETADVFTELERLRATVQEVEDTISQTKPAITTKIAHAEMVQIYKDNAPPIVPIVYNDLTDQLDGLREGDLMILASRPSVGKTAVALNFATHTARQNIPTGVFSLEMSSTQLHQRVSADICDISFYRLYRKLLNEDEIQRMYGEGAQIIENMPLQYDESRNIFQILSKIRIMAKNGVKLIIIDYLQIITTDGLKLGSREQEISFCSRSLKSIALELKIAIIALAQVSREVEKRAIKRPQVSDLRESGALEQDADIICLLYRPEFYGVKYWDCNWDGSRHTHGNGGDQDTEQQIELQFAKYRNGSPFVRRMRFWGDKMRLNDFDSINAYENSNRVFSGGIDDKLLDSEEDDFTAY